MNGGNADEKEIARSASKANDSKNTTTESVKIKENITKYPSENSQPMMKLRSETKKRSRRESEDRDENDNDENNKKVKLGDKLETSQKVKDSDMIGEDDDSENDEDYVDDEAMKDNDDDDDDDDAMEDTVDIQEELGEAENATNTTTNVIDKSAASTSNLNLRLPSEQTPSRLAEQVPVAPAVRFGGGVYGGAKRLLDIFSPPSKRNSTLNSVSPFPPPPASSSENFANSTVNRGPEKEPRSTSTPIEQAFRQKVLQSSSSQSEQSTLTDTGKQNQQPTNRPAGRLDGTVRTILHQDTNTNEPVMIGGAQPTQLPHIIRPLATHANVNNASSASLSALNVKDNSSTLGERNEMMDEKMLLDRCARPWHHKVHNWIVVFFLCHVVLAVYYDGAIVRGFWESIPSKSNEWLEFYETLWVGGDLVADADGTNNTICSATGTCKAVESEAEAILELEPIIVEKEEIVVEDVIEEVDNIALEERERELLRKRNLIANYKADVELAQQTLDKYETVVNDDKNQGEDWHFEEVLKAHHDEMRLWEEVLFYSQESLQGGASKQETKSILHDLVTVSPYSISHNDLELWDKNSVSIPGEGCNLEDLQYIVEDKIKLRHTNKKADKPLRRKQLLETKKYLTDLALSSARDLGDDERLSKFVDKWAEKEVQSLISGVIESSHNKEEDDDVDASNEAMIDFHNTTITNSPFNSPLDVQTVIDQQLEMELADSNGKFDYASIRSGGSVIRTGPRRTTLSIAENMPLFNRALSMTKIRFYGHGAEAALIPTYPKTALGQCWSFEREGSRKVLGIVTEKEKRELSEMDDDPYRGEYGTLAVNLASQIQVGSVAIEHPSEVIASSVASAVRKFRVMGFEDWNALGQPWLLGSFEYNIDTEESLQEYKVKTTDEYGNPVPKLRSIVLALDSNWGAEYLCLYRFRVHNI